MNERMGKQAWDKKSRKRMRAEEKRTGSEDWKKKGKERKR